MSKNNKKELRITRSVRLRTFSTLLACGTLAAIITYILFFYTQGLLKDRLQERIVAIASSGASQIDYKDIESITSLEDLEKPEAKYLAQKLSSLRDANNNLRFAYILRRTDDPDVLEFVMDAESLDSKDLQEKRAGESLADDELAPLPGDSFEIADYPSLRNEAFNYPAAENDLQKDQWSTQLSAYAPIFNEAGTAIAVLGVDVEVTDYTARVNATLLPFLLFILFLISLLTFLSLLLIRFWGEKVKILQELDRQKDELLGIVAHQLSKPITALRWNLESLLDGDLGTINEEQKKETISMRAQAVNLADLVSMILDVSRIQLGKIQLTPQPLNLADLFKEIVDVINPTIVEKKINFIQKLPKKLPVALLDKRYTRMTIENLLSNAVKYTPEGGKVTLDVSIVNGMLRCTVADTGCGIPEADKEKIFGKMFRASNVRNTVDGNGFGLYVAKGAIEAQGGTMSFTSAEGKGTTFMIELPIKEA